MIAALGLKVITLAYMMGLKAQGEHHAIWARGKSTPCCTLRARALHVVPSRALHVVPSEHSMLYPHCHMSGARPLHVVPSGARPLHVVPSGVLPSVRYVTGGMCSLFWCPPCPHWGSLRSLEPSCTTASTLLGVRGSATGPCPLRAFLSLVCLQGDSGIEDPHPEVSMRPYAYAAMPYMCAEMGALATKKGHTTCTYAHENISVW